MVVNTISLLFLISGLLVYVITGDISFPIYSSICATVILMLVNKLSPCHPSVWYLFFVNLYHLSICLLYYLGYREVYNLDGIVIINSLSIIGFNLSYYFFVDDKENYINSSPINVSNSVLFIFFVIFLVLSLYTPVAFIASGAKGKSDFSNSFGSLYSMLNIIAAMVIVKNYRLGKKIALAMFLYLLMSTLLLGERNIILSFSIVLIVIGYAKFNLSTAKIVVISLIMILSIPIMGVYKNLFTRDNFQKSEQSVLVSILNGEFRSAGYNIDEILSDDKLELKYGSSFAQDVVRAILPGFVYKSENSVKWYNEKYHPHIVEQGRGYGFSMAAEGYVNFSWLGVIIWFFFMGIILRFLYFKSMKNDLFLVVYASMIPVSIYGLRGDWSTILSPMFKQVFCLLLLVYFVDWLIAKAKRNL